MFITSLALVANERVFLDCSTWLKAGLMVHIIAVRAFPPSEGCNMRVSFESLYGMWPFFLPALQQTEEAGKANPPLKLHFQIVDQQSFAWRQEYTTTEVVHSTILLRATGVYHHWKLMIKILICEGKKKKKKKKCQWRSRTFNTFLPIPVYFPKKDTESLQHEDITYLITQWLLISFFYITSSDVNKDAYHNCEME